MACSRCAHALQACQTASSMGTVTASVQQVWRPWWPLLQARGAMHGYRSLSDVEDAPSLLAAMLSTLGEYTLSYQEVQGDKG